MVFIWISVPVIKAKMNKYAVSFPEIAKKYDERSPKLSKVGLLLLIPLSTLFLMGLFYKRKQPFFDHFIIATEISSFYIFSYFLMLPLFSFIISKTVPEFNHIFEDGSWPWFLVLGLLGLFIIIAFKNFYKESWFITILKGLFFLFIFAKWVKYIYSVLIFLLVMLFL